MVPAPTPDRWENYILRGGPDFECLWQSILGSGSRNLLFVVGRGFDPRIANAVKTVLSQGGSGLRHCMLVEFDEGETSPSRQHDNLTADNVTTIEDLFEQDDQITTKHIRMWSDDGRRRVGSRGAAEVFGSTNDLKPYTDVLVDISALPRALYIPMLAKLLFLVDQLGGPRRLNLHVLVDDDPGLDEQISPEGLSDDANYLHGFESGIEQEATAEVPKVWMPILGEGKTGHFVRIYDLIAPDEIAPIIPFPCSHPRRTDNLILEYRTLLFDSLRVEAANFIYVPEQNPFGVYREILAAIRHYTSALDPLGGCKIVISALSSKLLSVGALLAAYDLKQAGYPVGIAHVHSSGYRMQNISMARPVQRDLFDVWIAGAPYDSA